MAGLLTPVAMLVYHPAKATIVIFVNAWRSCRRNWSA